jgi:membrane-bound ClpP family serine protease
MDEKKDDKTVDEDLPDIFGMPPEFYRFELLNALFLIIVGIILLALTAFDFIHIFLGIGMVAILAGVSMTVSSVNFVRTRSSGPLHESVAKSFKYRMISGLICYSSGGALLLAYLIQ